MPSVRPMDRPGCVWILPGMIRWVAILTVENRRPLRRRSAVVSAQDASASVWVTTDLVSVRLSAVDAIFYGVTAHRPIPPTPVATPVPTFYALFLRLSGGTASIVVRLRHVSEPGRLLSRRDDGLDHWHRRHVDCGTSLHPFRPVVLELPAEEL
jgi:hypothetical protein